MPNTPTANEASRSTKQRLQFTPQLAVVSVGYFVQGIKTQMALLAERYVMRELLFDPAKTELWISISKFPWVIKPLYGFISDTFPILGQHRRPYLIICGIVGFVAYAVMSIAGHRTAATMLATMTLAELTIAVSDVVVDGIVVEQARGESQATSGTLQSLCWGSEAVGSLASACLVGPAISRAGPLAVLFGMGCLPILVAVAAAAMHEPYSLRLKHTLSDAGELDQLSPESDRLQAGAQPADTGWQEPRHSHSATWAEVASKLQTLVAALLLPTVLVPALYIFLNQGPSGLDSTVFFFYVNRLGFQPTFVGAIQLLDGAAKIAGVLIFNVFLKQAPLRPLLLSVTILCTCVSLTQLVLVTGLNRQLGIPDKAFALVDGAVVGAIARMAFMPIYILAARVCPPGMEATLYAGLMSVSNAGQNMSSAVIALVSRLVGVTSTDFSNTWVLILTAQVTNIASLALLPLLPGSDPAPDTPAGSVRRQHAGTLPGGKEEDIESEVEMMQGSAGLSTRHTDAAAADTVALLSASGMLHSASRESSPTRQRTSRT